MFLPSMLGDILKLLPRELVRSSAKRHRSDRYCKSFFTWDHLVAMLTAQLSGASSLRDVALLSGLHNCRHYHLNCTTVRRSTLADANMRRDAAVFGDIARGLIAASGRGTRKSRAMLALLDSTPIRLAGRGHDWARTTRSRAHNQGLKLHVLVTPADGSLDYVSVTGMNVTDITDAAQMPLQKGRIYVFDKGYCSYDWWHRIIAAGSHFVTRLKANAAYEVLREEPCGNGSSVLRDRLIRLSNKQPRGGKVNPLAGRTLRLVSVQHPAGRDRPPLQIVSDMLEADAAAIAAHYKKRWDIELLFKWIKQNLKIKGFMGENRNAIAIQIYCAIIAYTLLTAYRSMVRTSGKMSLKELLLFFKTSLFTTTSPPDTKAKPPDQHQQMLPL